MSSWTTADSNSLYNLDAWGLDLFKINDDGHLVVTAGDHEIDLKKVVDDLEHRGVMMPTLLRLSDVLKARVDSLAQSFNTAIHDLGYKGHYRGVYPIKVNQQRHLVEDLVKLSKPHHLGLECGSKPELLIVLAKLRDPEALIICNGYKDDEYIKLALLSRKLGRNTIIVIEQFSELGAVLHWSKVLDVEPVIGVRAKLSQTGSGRWSASAGERAKFGLTPQELVNVIHNLRDVEKLQSLQLLHFHIGSQVSNIRSLKKALHEGGRIYSELKKMGAQMGYLDVGGGLGVDYTGSRSAHDSSMNYDISEYAHSVIETIRDLCDADQLAHPHIVTEAGRALVAYSSVLVIPVVDVEKMAPAKAPETPTPTCPQSYRDMWSIYSTLEGENPLEAYHDAMEVKEDTYSRFKLGLCGLEERARVNEWFWTICQTINGQIDDDESLYGELKNLKYSLADIYFCNFSVFQSAPDFWAIDQLFPIMPIHRLDEKPDRLGVIVDLTCDSDGKVDRFADRHQSKPALELHSPQDKPYYLGIFLVGAYQEILGDLHNLFGDTHAVHVSGAKNARGYRFEGLVEGNTVEEVLKYVQYERPRLLRNMRAAVEAAYESGTLTVPEGKLFLRTYTHGLGGYTYLTEEND